MTCMYCGKELPELPYASFCPYCGKRPPVPVKRSRYAEYGDLHKELTAGWPFAWFTFDRPAAEIAKTAYGITGLGAAKINECGDEVVDLYHELWMAMYEATTRVLSQCQTK